MLQKLFSHLRKINSGFSFIESLVSLSILSLMAVCIVAGILIANKSYAKSKADVQQTYIIYETDKYIRNIAKTVRPPYWIRKMDVNFSGSSFDLCWVNGISSSQTFHLNSNIKITKIDLVGKKDSIPLGMRVFFEYNECEYSTSCLFASFPYGDFEI